MPLLRGFPVKPHRDKEQNVDQPFHMGQVRAEMHYGMIFSLCIVLIATIVRMVFLQSLGTRFGFLTFYPAMIIAALYGGMRSGVFATVFSAVMADYFWIEPIGFFFVERLSDSVALGIYVTNGILMSWIADRLLKANAQLNHTAVTRGNELEHQCAESKRFEAEFHLLAEALPQLVWITRADGWNVYFNKKWVDYTGLSLEESSGHGWNKPFHPDDQQRAWDAWQAAVNQYAPYSLECRLRRADGSYRWWLVRGVPQINESGTIERWFCTCTDIHDLTWRKQAEDAEAERNRNIRLLADTIPQLAWIANPDGYIYWYNRRWYEYTGTTPEQMEGWGWRSVHDENSLPEVMERWLASIATGQPLDMVFPLRGADGQFRPFLTRISPLRDLENRVIHWFGTNTDISEQKEMEQALRKSKIAAEQANDAKTRFLAAVSHDLRQPLQAQCFLLFNVSQQAACASQIKACLQMERTLDATESMLSRLMDFAALESGSVPVERTIFRLDAVVSGIVEEVDEEAASKGLSIGTRVSPCWTESDPVLLGRIVRNLISNAVRYTNRGRILVGIRHRGVTLRIEVWDTGKGIPPDQQLIIFEEFRQLDNPERCRTKGHGLGLAIVAKTAELLGHRIALRSVVGHGSVFAIEVPQAAEPNQQLITKGDDAACGAGTVLVIEDDSIQAEAIDLVLSGFGYTVVVARDAAGAMAVRHHWLDLIISDYRLPGDQTGVEVVTALRQANARSIPAIIMTGDTQASIALEAARAACDIVHKPCSPKALISLVARAIHR